MLEVCFSDSDKGLLTYAQNRKFESDGADARVLLNRKWKDIAGLSFGLSVGDIKSPIRLVNCPRKEHIRSVFSFERFNERLNMNSYVNKYWLSYIRDLKKVRSNPPEVRVWVDATPDTQCGLLFVADLLEDSKAKVSVVRLPQQTIGKDGCVVENRGWGSVDEKMIMAFLPQERVLTEKEVHALSDRWKLLKEENAPLRVIENGSVVSADISYYDDLIRKEFPKDTCYIVHLVSNAMAKQNILTEDVFVAKRIQHFIESGELVVVGKTDEGFYKTTVACAK